MSKIKLNKYNNENLSVDYYLCLVDFSEISNVLSENLEFRTCLIDKPYYPYDYNKDIKQIFGEI